MARSLTAGMQAELAEQVYRPVNFVELEFDGGTERLHTWLGDFELNGNTFTGLGEFSEITVIQEGGSLAAEGVTLTVNGLSTQWLQRARDEHVVGRIGRIWFGLLDDDYDLIADPDGPYVFRMDAMEIIRGEQTGSVKLNLQSAAVLWNKTNAARYTHEDQQIDHPGDLFFEFVPEMADLELHVGDPAGSSSTTSPAFTPPTTWETTNDGAAGPVVGPGVSVGPTDDENPITQRP